MDRFKSLFFVFWVIVLPLVSWGQIREWRDLSGNSVRGEITARKNGAVTLRLENGETFLIPLDNLTEADRRLAFAWRPKLSNPKIAFGQPWTIPDMQLEMVWMPPGKFRLGSSVLEKGRGQDERLTEVVLSRGFWLSKYEVTQGQWALLMRARPSYVEGEKFPVEHVSWNDAAAFCRKMTESERRKGSLPRGFVYSLPSEAQWEYACRAGTTTAFSHGNEAGGLDKYAWSSANATKRTHPVGSLRPNEWGLYDMHGNVLEWCRDVYGEYPKSRAIDPKGPSIGEKRVARGGSILNPRIDCRSARRYKGDVDEKDFVGFRIALTPSWR